MPAQRPHFSKTLGQLISAGKASLRRGDKAALSSVLNELEHHRTTAGAAAAAEELRALAKKAAFRRARGNSSSTSRSTSGRTRKAPPSRQQPAHLDDGRQAAPGVEYVRGEDFQVRVGQLVRNARRRLVYSTYIMRARTDNERSLIESVVRARRTCKKVEVILGNHAKAAKSNQKALSLLQDGGVTVMVGAVHAKFLVVDNSLLIGSSNSYDNFGLEANIFILKARNIIPEVLAHANEYLADDRLSVL